MQPMTVFAKIVSSSKSRRKVQDTKLEQQDMPVSTTENEALTKKSYI